MLSRGFFVVDDVVLIIRLQKVFLHCGHHFGQCCCMAGGTDTLINVCRSQRDIYLKNIGLFSAQRLKQSDLKIKNK